MESQGRRHIAPGKHRSGPFGGAPELGNFDQLVFLSLQGGIAIKEESDIVHEVLQRAAMPIAAIEVWRFHLLQLKPPGYLPCRRLLSRLHMRLDITLLALQPL